MESNSGRVAVQPDLHQIYVTVVWDETDRGKKVSKMVFGGLQTH